MTGNYLKPGNKKEEISEAPVKINKLIKIDPRGINRRYA